MRSRLAVVFGAWIAAVGFAALLSGLLAWLISIGLRINGSDPSTGIATFTAWVGGCMMLLGASVISAGIGPERAPT